MKLFLDSSVLIAASGSGTGASRQIFRCAGDRSWTLLASPYVIEEVSVNVPGLGLDAEREWARLHPELTIVEDVLTLDRAVVFEPAKDRPILFTALAWSDVLLTLDRADFGGLLGSAFYGMPILTPGMLLERARRARSEG